MDYRAFIETELQKAANLANQYFGKVSGTTKPGDNNQVLTEADLAVGKQLVAAIQSSFPDHNIIDEEAGVINRDSEYTWVIDPIDGTSNFAAGLPHYGILLGLLKGAEPIAGGVALPYFKELYIAARGQGAYCNGKRLQVQAPDRLQDCLVAYGIDGHPEDPEHTRAEAALLGEILLNIRNLRDSNSAYDVAMVAAGRYAALLAQTSKIWDNVAQHIVIEEAGGVYTSFDGRPIDYSDPLSKAGQNFTMCVAAPHIHQQLQEVIRAHGMAQGA
ncbi:inositol monophosphatase [Candidatus Saccharibacteria bacterium]|nr:inositol monophosphatase [Candidatus Saccharibacteria bacterium]